MDVGISIFPRQYAQKRPLPIAFKKNKMNTSSPSQDQYDLKMLTHRSPPSLDKCITDCPRSPDEAESSSTSGSQKSAESRPIKRFCPDSYSYVKPRLFLTRKPMFIKYRNSDFGNSYVLEPSSYQDMINATPSETIDMGMWKEMEVWISRAEFELKLLRMFKLSMNIPIYSHASAFSVINPEKFNPKDSVSCKDDELESEDILSLPDRADDDQYLPNDRRNKRIRITKCIRKREKALNMGEDGLYHCPFCPKIFKMGQQLGGHCSRAHPGQSLIYREKMQKRKKYYDFLQKSKHANPLKAYRQLSRKE